MAAAVKLPPKLVPFPPLEIRKSIPAESWRTALDAWAALASIYVVLPSQTFERATGPSQSLVPFLTTYITQEAQLAGSEAPSDRHHALHRRVFLLLDRVYIAGAHKREEYLVDPNFLGDLCTIYRGSDALPLLLESRWTTSGPKIEKSLAFSKRDMIMYLEDGHLEESLTRRLTHLARAFPPAGVILMTGSDLLDAIIEAYPKLSPEKRRRLLALTYLSLTSLLHGSKPQTSLLFDHVFSLTSAASSTLLSDLVNSTPLVARIMKNSQIHPSSRMKSVLDILEAARDPGAARPLRRRKIDKGKARAHTQDTDHTIHVHRMSLITQIQDLFPELGSAFIAKLLDEYDDDVETATAHLLDDSLPPHLATANRSEALPPPSTTAQTTDQAPHLSPRTTPPPPPSPTPPPERRNIHNNDALSTLSIRASQLHLGRRENPTADALLAQKPSSTAKANILAALSAFDADDDERDDTYDLADVGGTVDAAEPEPGARVRPVGQAGGAASESEVDPEIEAVLFAILKASPEVFERGAQVRKGRERLELRQRTGWSDEQIEGWKVMLDKSPASRLRRLEERYAGGGLGQRGLERTRWAGNNDTTDEEGGDDGPAADPSARGRGGYRGRGSGGGGGRGRGNVAGPTGEHATQVQRRRKETNKSGRANHNRKDQSARKMARGFGGAPAG
ncbi:MAG: hypothetical protein M1828_000189 [Chrysothrix sp. TS-e1954]|nr:MAG: hypothetical protein M1828_000189 [Chrysothrix sp. TS-e1954]